MWENVGIKTLKCGKMWDFVGYCGETHKNHNNLPWRILKTE